MKGDADPAGRFDPLSPIGSTPWWDYQLAHNWELNGGPAQTRYFTGEMLGHLPPTERDYLRSNSLSILDCGCATGEGVAILAQVFPSCTVAGLDIARSAIETARARHPQHEFILSEDGGLPHTFDVIFTSNVLEHYQDAFVRARQQAMRCGLLYLILVPFREYPREPGHLVTFTENSFPDFCGGLARLSVIPFATNPSVWSGHQVLVVYASAAYLDQRPRQGDTPDQLLESSLRAYFDAPRETQFLLEELALQRAGKKAALEEAALVRGLRRAQMIHRLARLLAPRGTWRRTLVDHLAGRPRFKPNP